MKSINMIPIAAGFFLMISSCTKEELNQSFENPIDLELSVEWLEDSVSQEQTEIWYRCAIGSDVSQVIVEWSELDFHGSSRNYTGDVLVSAFHLDGETSYFLDEDNGYGIDSHLINLSAETGLLIRVKKKEEFSGTFALKAFEKINSEEIVLTEVEVGDSWLEGTIGSGEILGYRIKGGLEGQELIVQWSEFDSPEQGFTADIKGSVYRLDQETPYVQAENGKNFEGKDSSHSDNPKSIVLDAGETEFIVIISLNDPSKPGSFAIQVK